MSAGRRRPGRGLPFVDAGPLLSAETHLRQAKKGAVSQTAHHALSPLCLCQTLCSPGSHTGLSQLENSPLRADKAASPETHGRHHERPARRRGQTASRQRHVQGSSTGTKSRAHRQLGAAEKCAMTRPHDESQRTFVSSVFRRVFLLHDKQLKEVSLRRSAKRPTTPTTPSTPQAHKASAGAPQPVSSRPWQAMPMSCCAFASSCS